jgi:hypothetical protein
MSMISNEPQWESLLAETRLIGKFMGIQSEADVERLCDEFRRERLQRQSDTQEEQPGS